MHPSLEAWASFYVIVGSSAGALTGLQFVVMTLIAQTPAPTRGQAISAFGTPNVVHFCAALLVAAILSAPWSALRNAGTAVAVCGTAGVFYSFVVTRRAHLQQAYQPVFEDWLWHTMLPPLAYGALLLGGVVLGPRSAGVLFVIGAATLLLVFIGIHNAWDTVTYLMTRRLEREPAPTIRESHGAAPPAAGPAGGRPTSSRTEP